MFVSAQPALIGATITEEYSHIGVRIALPSDTPVLVRLIRLLAAEHGETADCLTPKVLAAALWGGSLQLNALVAETDECIAGCILYSVGFSTFSARPRIWIEDLIVALRFRRRGVGNALLGAVQERADLMGAVEAQLTVSDSNERAQAFWVNAGSEEKLGWTLRSLSMAGCHVR